MSQELLKQQYQDLADAWTRAEARRQGVVDRFKALDTPITIDHPIWEEWNDADERAGSAREAMRSFLAANEHNGRR